MKVAIVVGHTAKKPGADSPWLPPEFEYNSKVAECLKDIADVFYHDTYKDGYTSMIKRTSKRINAGNYDLVLSLHYNSASPKAHGCETIYYFANKSAKRMGEQFSKLISEKMGVKNRGVKARVNKNDRGFAAVYYPRPTVLLLEPFFGSNEADAKKFQSPVKYAEVIRQFLCERDFA